MLSGSIIGFILTNGWVTAEPNMKIHVSCESDSMGNTIRCNDNAITNRFDPLKDKLEEGKIYVYKRWDDKLIIHRLVLCLDEKCNKTVFKGDNNKRGEIVHKKDIKFVVRGVEYS